MVESRKDTWKNWKITRDRKQTDMCHLLISPRGLLPACHVAILFATRVAHHVNCQQGRSHVERQRVLWHLPVRTCTRGSGSLVTSQRCVNEAIMVPRRNFLSSWKKYFSDISAVSSRQTKLDASFLTNWNSSQIHHRILCATNLSPSVTKLFIADASISTSD
jgi:hypothetical protein